MGDVALFYSIKVSTPSLYQQGVKDFAGIVKVNIGIVALQTFLKNLTLIGKGYVLLVENNDFVIGGSINTTAFVPSNRMSVFDLSDRNAGQLMKEISKTYSGFSNLPTEFYITSLGEAYLVSYFTYQYMNIEWRTFLIVYDSDISRTTNINTVISLGVALT